MKFRSAFACQRQRRQAAQDQIIVTKVRLIRRSAGFRSENPIMLQYVSWQDSLTPMSAREDRPPTRGGLGADQPDFGPGSCSGPHCACAQEVAQPPVRTIEPPIEPPAEAVFLGRKNGGTRAGSAAPSVILAKSQIPHPTDDVMDDIAAQRIG